MQTRESHHSRSAKQEAAGSGTTNSDSPTSHKRRSCRPKYRSASVPRRETAEPPAFPSDEIHGSRTKNSRKHRPQSPSHRPTRSFISKHQPNHPDDRRSERLRLDAQKFNAPAWAFKTVEFPLPPFRPASPSLPSRTYLQELHHCVKTTNEQTLCGLIGNLGDVSTSLVLLRR